MTRVSRHRRASTYAAATAPGPPGRGGHADGARPAGLAHPLVQLASHRRAASPARRDQDDPAVVLAGEAPQLTGQPGRDLGRAVPLQPVHRRDRDDGRARRGRPAAGGPARAAGVSSGRARSTRSLSSSPRTRSSASATERLNSSTSAVTRAPRSRVRRSARPSSAGAARAAAGCRGARCRPARPRRTTGPSAAATLRPDARASRDGLVEPVERGPPRRSPPSRCRPAVEHHDASRAARRPARPPRPRRRRRAAARR